MNAQGSLFPARPGPLARQFDRETSVAAGQRLVASGALAASLARTLRALAAWPGERPPTSQELARGDLRDRYEYARRLADLEHRGLVLSAMKRPCTVTGHAAVTWVLTPEGRRAAGRVGG